MPKVKPAFRHTDEPAAPVPIIAEAVTRELAEIACQPEPEPEVAAAAPLVSVTDLETAKARIAAIFAEAVAAGPLPPDDSGAAQLRKEAIADLVERGHRHSDAVAIADRMQALLEEDEDWTAAYALAVAEDECLRPVAVPKLTPIAEPFVAELPVPTLETIRVTDPCPSEVIRSDELAQILHNFERDTTRLRKLLGMEGVKKTRQKKEA